MTCKHGETSCVCTQCDLETIDRLAPKLLDCGHYSTPSTRFPGYGSDSKGNTFCYQCMAEREKNHMVEHGAITFYLDISTKEITNWTGVLRFKVLHTSKSWHNIARVRYDAWFKGPDDYIWHAIQYGDNTQVAHCKKTKRKGL